MTRFLFAALLITSSTVLFQRQAKAEEQAGQMIDQMMNQEALADAASAIITAESALPKPMPPSTTTGDNMDNAVKLAMAKIPEAKADKVEAVTESAPLAAAVTAPSTTTYNESLQPVFNAESPAIVKEKKASSSSQLWWRMISSLAIVLVVFGGGMYGFKKFPGTKKINARGRMIEVMSQHHLGPKRSLAVVRVAGETCLIGITDQNITILKTLSLLDDDIPSNNKENENSPHGNRDQSKKESKTLSTKFQETLAATFTKSAPKTPSFDQTEKVEPAFYTRSAKVAAANTVPEEDFTMQGLREIVGERLKSMREL